MNRVIFGKSRVGAAKLKNDAKVRKFIETENARAEKKKAARKADAERWFAELREKKK